MFRIFKKKKVEDNNLNVDLSLDSTDIESIDDILKRCDDSIKVYNDQIQKEISDFSESHEGSKAILRKGSKMYDEFFDDQTCEILEYADKLNKQNEAKPTYGSHKYGDFLTKDMYETLEFIDRLEAKNVAVETPISDLERIVVQYLNLSNIRTGKIRANMGIVRHTLKKALTFVKEYERKLRDTVLKAESFEDLRYRWLALCGKYSEEIEKLAITRRIDLLLKELDSSDQLKYKRGYQEEIKFILDEWLQGVSDSCYQIKVYLVAIDKGKFGIRALCGEDDEIELLGMLADSSNNYENNGQINFNGGKRY